MIERCVRLALGLIRTKKLAWISTQFTTDKCAETREPTFRALWGLFLKSPLRKLHPDSSRVRTAEGARLRAMAGDAAREKLSDSLDAYAEASQQRHTRTGASGRGRPGGEMGDRVRIAQRGDVDHGNLPTHNWATHLRETTPTRQRPATASPSRAASSRSPARTRGRRLGRAHDPHRLSPHRSVSPYSRDRLRATPSPARSKSPGRLDRTAPYVVQRNPGKVKNFTSFRHGVLSPGTRGRPSNEEKRRRSSEERRHRSTSPVRKRATSPASSRSSLQRSSGTSRPYKVEPGPMRHGTPSKFFGAPPKVKRRRSEYSRSQSPSSTGRLSTSGRLSPSSVASRHGTTHQKVMDEPTAPAGWSWLNHEEQKLSEALKQCNRDAEREWSRIQRSHPELRSIPMPSLKGSWHERMMQEVKWMLKKKVEEQEARAKRMALRIQRLEEDAAQADNRRADLERAMASMAKSHEKELQDVNKKVEELQREKEVLLDELDKRCTEIEHAQSQMDEVRKNEETTTWAFKTAVTSSEYTTAELRNELKAARDHAERERERAKAVERERDSERVEAEVKLGMLESRLEEMRGLSTEMEGEMRRLREEASKARADVEVEKQRSARTIQGMQSKLSVWSEEGSLAIHQAQQLVARTEDKAREREREVVQEAKESMLACEKRAKEEREQLRREVEKERRSERDELLRKQASERIALEAKYKAEIEQLKAEIEQLRTEMEQRVADESKRQGEEKQDLVSSLNAELDKQAGALTAAQKELEKQAGALTAAKKELATVQRELKEAEQKHVEYEKVLEAATESEKKWSATKERSDHLVTVAQNDVKRLQGMIATLQMELAGNFNEMPQKDAGQTERQMHRYVLMSACRMHRFVEIVTCDLRFILLQKKRRRTSCANRRLKSILKRLRRLVGTVSGEAAKMQTRRKTKKKEAGKGEVVTVQLIRALKSVKGEKGSGSGRGKRKGSGKGKGSESGRWKEKVNGRGRRKGREKERKG
jgi:hypothetical protein